MNELDREVPPRGEEIHLPGPSLMPVLLAVGLAFALVGVTTYIIFTIAGLALSIVIVIRWIRSTRDEIDELPPEH